jgi:hypothetical protein
MIDHDQSKFVDFHHYEQRIATLEAKQRMVHEAMLAYVEADISATWMATAKELSEALHKALYDEVCLHGQQR